MSGHLKIFHNLECVARSKMLCLLFSLVFLLDYILMSQAYAAQTSSENCEAPPNIDIQIVQEDARFEMNASAQQLKKQIREPQGALEHMSVIAAMSDMPQMTHKLKFRALERNGNAGLQTCVRLKDVVITLKLSPHIAFTQGLNREACKFKNTFRHEHEHVLIDHALAQKYKNRVADALAMILSIPSDYSSGWHSNDSEGFMEDIEYSVSQSLDMLYQTMMRERIQNQHNIDTPQLYRQALAECR